MTLSQRLSKFTGECDKIFNHVLGYVIAFSALIAFADVLGDGKIMQYIPWLYWIWVIAQGLGVEFQVFVLIRRLPRLWCTNRGVFWGNFVFIVALCMMSVLIGSVFVQHDNAGGTIEQAMMVLGINHIGFVYARAGLAILLVVLIGIDRAMEQEHDEIKKQVDIVVMVKGLEDRIAEVIQAGINRNREQLLAELRQELHSVTMTLSTVSVTVEAMEQRTQSLLAITPARTVDSTPVSTDTAEQRVMAVLENNPSLSIRALAKEAGVAPATAERYKKKYEAV